MPMVTDKLPLPTENELANTSISEQILESLKTSKTYRHAFVEEKVRTSLAAQILAIREQRQLSRAQMAELMKKSRPWIFRLEDPNAPPPTISTLLSVAAAFDVDLEIRFSPFSELLDRIDRLTPECFEAPSFTEEFSKDLARNTGSAKSPQEQPAGMMRHFLPAAPNAAEQLGLGNIARIDSSQLFDSSARSGPGVATRKPASAQSAFAYTGQTAK